MTEQLDLLRQYKRCTFCKNNRAIHLTWVPMRDKGGKIATNAFQKAGVCDKCLPFCVSFFKKRSEKDYTKMQIFKRMQQIKMSSAVRRSLHQKKYRVSYFIVG